MRVVTEEEFLSIKSELFQLADYHSWAGQHEESLDVKEFIAKLERDVKQFDDVIYEMAEAMISNGKKEIQ